jgi:uncharacterized YceG family protein
VRRLFRDDSDPPRRRSPEERERARLERIARREGHELPAEQQPEPDLAPEPEPVLVPEAHDELAADAHHAAELEPHHEAEPEPVHAPEPPPVRVIQPEPAAPPAAPAGALPDPREDRPLGTRRVGRARRAARAVVTPPADVPRGPARPRRSRGRRAIVAVGVLLAALVLAAVVILYQPFAGAAGDPVRVTIPSGSDAGAIGDLLAGEDVVPSGTAFAVRATLAGKRGDLRSGPYTLRRNMTYGAVLDALTARPDPSSLPATIDVTIPEGPSARELAPRVAKTGLQGDYQKASRVEGAGRRPGGITLPKGTRTLEGLLFPATYEVPTNGGAEALVGRQLDAFKQAFSPISLRRARRKNLTAYDVVIIASMVEREARVASERPKIAAVIYNRLSDGTPLGIDATTRYELNNWTEPLTNAQLRKDTPYNTRTRAGLPPTPIGNPGTAALRAAARPARSGARYFVVKPGTCGEHAFSTTFEQFQADSRRYNAARAQRGGKSPSSC